MTKLLTIGVRDMTPTKKQKERRYSPFKFTARGRESWFYIYGGTASFHQINKEGQQNVYGVRIPALIKALKACGYIALLLCCLPTVAEASDKKVITDYDDFLQIVSIKEHAEKLRNKAVAETGILVKLKAEQDVIIELQAKQIEACEAIVKQHEQLGETEAQITRAVEAELEIQKANRKWWAGGGVTAGVLATIIVMWALN